jgi:hypothetical protein
MPGDVYFTNFLQNIFHECHEYPRMVKKTNLLQNNSLID